MPLPDSHSPIQPQGSVALVAAAFLAAAATAGVLVASRLGWETAPPPFVWTDVALVAFLAGLPLAALVSGSIGPPLARLALAAAAGLLALLLFAPIATPIWQSNPLVAQLARTMAAAGAGLALVAGGASLSFTKQERTASPLNLFNLALAIAVSLALPWLYVQARCRHDLARLEGLMEQTRIGEAGALAERLLVLAPHATVRGFPLLRVAEQSRRIVADLQSRVQTPLPASADVAQRLQRAGDLGMLGRTAEALAVLDASPAAAQSAAVNHLRGVIHDARNEFGLALEAYRAAREAALAHPRSAESNAVVIDATRGMAYCERKLGRYADAERTYLELLAFEPTAETHFLLAQFYEDTQQASLAQDHARQAMALDPQRYAARGRQLIDKLMTHHFGCWSVFASEPRR